MNYINDNTKEQLTYYILRDNNPTKSLPQDGTEIIDEVWYLIHTTPRPSCDIYVEEVQEIEPIKTGEIYDQAWEVVTLSINDQEKALQNSQTIKISETWSYANANIRDYENGLVQDQNSQKSKRLNQMNDTRTNKRINSEALSPEEDIDQTNYEGYVTFAEDTNTQANTTETNILAMTDGNAIDDIVVKEEPFPEVPYSSLTQPQREMLIGELVSQSTIIFADYDAADQTGMAEFIDFSTKYTMVGSYSGMPGGREVYEVIGENSAASIDSGWVITQHMTQDTYFDTTDSVFKK